MLNDDRFLISFSKEEEINNNYETITNYKTNPNNSNYNSVISNSNKNQNDINFHLENNPKISNIIFNKNKSQSRIVNELIEENNFEIFKIFFLYNKNIFLKSFFNNKNIFKSNANDVNNNNNDNNEEQKPEFIYLLHVLSKKNMLEFVEFILNEVKEFLNNLSNNNTSQKLSNENKEKENLLFDENSNNLNNNNNKNENNKLINNNNTNNFSDKEFINNLLYDFINKKDNHDYFPIHYAITTGNLKLINLLIDNLGDVSLLTKNGFNCLHLATTLNKLEVFVFIYEKEKYKKKITLEDTDFQGNTILHVSCFSGAYDIFDFLISQEINVNIKDKKGNSPLHYAVYNGI